MAAGEGAALRLAAPRPESLPEDGPRHDPEAARAAIAAAQARAAELQPPPAIRADVSAEALAAFAAREAEAVRPETPQARFWRWALVEASRLRGEALSEAEARGLDSYLGSLEARSLQREIDHHGFERILGRPDPRPDAAA